MSQGSDDSSSPDAERRLRNGALLTHSELAGVPATADWHRWIEAGRGPTQEFDLGDWLADTWSDDLRLLSELGFDRLGLTLEWAVLEPTMGSHDTGAVEQLRSVLDGAAELGLAVTAYLVDGSLPGWFAIDERGFLDDRSRSLLWPRHVDWIGEAFGDRVDAWVPIREPVHHAVRANLLGMAPPGNADPEDTGKAVKALLLAEGEAWRVLRGSAPVASHQTARLFLHPDDNVRAESHADDLDRLHRAWVSALREGVVRLPGLPDAEATVLRDAFDTVVLQLRPPVRIDGDGGWAPTDPGFLTEGLVTALHECVDDVGPRSVEISVDLAPVADDGSAQIDHLGTLRAEVEGLGVHRWWQSSPIDGWHWHDGHSKPGLVTIDRELRPAAALLQR